MLWTHNNLERIEVELTSNNLLDTFWSERKETSCPPKCFQMYGQIIQTSILFLFVILFSHASQADYETQRTTRIFKVKILVLSPVMICGILSLKSKAKGNGADMCSKVIWKTDVFRSLLLPQWDKIIFTNGTTQRQISRNTTSLPNLSCLGIVNAGQFRLQRQLFKMKHSGNVIQGSHYFSKAQVTFKIQRISLDTFNNIFMSSCFDPQTFCFSITHLTILSWKLGVLLSFSHLSKNGVLKQLSFKMSIISCKILNWVSRAFGNNGPNSHITPHK